MVVAGVGTVVVIVGLGVVYGYWAIIAHVRRAGPQLRPPYGPPDRGRFLRWETIWT